MSRSILFTITDAQDAVMGDHDLRNECLRVNEYGTLYAYTEDEAEVTLWVIEADGNYWQERQENYGWVRYNFDEDSGEWVEAEEDEDE